MTSSFAVVQFGLIWMRETRCAVEEAANGGKTTEVTNQVFDIIKIIKIINIINIIKAIKAILNATFKTISAICLRSSSWLSPIRLSAQSFTSMIT